MKLISEKEGKIKKLNNFTFEIFYEKKCKNKVIMYA